MAVSKVRLPDFGEYEQARMPFVNPRYADIETDDKSA